jgi:hypothetical protein
MRSWSDRPFAGEVSRHLVARQGRSLGTEGGEAKVVYEIADHPGWVAKLYKRPMLRLDADNLATLIELPGSLDVSDLALVDSITAWPTARIVEDSATVGVVMALAPSHFFVEFRLRGNRTCESRVLPIDWLVGDGAKLARQGIETPDAGSRWRIAREFLVVGDLLERRNVVYGDWSYRNSLWSPARAQVFLLDMDSCRLGRRLWMESPEWEDPLYPVHSCKPLDCYNDRYKLAVLTIRCLTGIRGDPVQAFGRLPGELQSARFGTIVHRALTAGSAEQRPTAGELLTALSSAAPARPHAAAAGSNVTGQRPVRRSAGNGNRDNGTASESTGQRDVTAEWLRQLADLQAASSAATGPKPWPGGPPPRAGGPARPGTSRRPPARPRTAYPRSGSGGTYSASAGPGGERSGARRTAALIAFMIAITIVILVLVLLPMQMDRNSGGKF